LRVDNACTPVKLAEETPEIPQPARREKFFTKTIKAHHMRTQHIESQQLPARFRKFVIIFVTCLAGLNIYIMLDLFLYKGLKLVHCSFMVFPVIIAAFGWCLWPKARNK
jgi:hypothetical protein